MEYAGRLVSISLQEVAENRRWHGHCQCQQRRSETMRLNGIKKIGGAILGLMLFVGIMAVSSSTAQAQYPYWNQDQYRRQERERRERERELQRERERQARQGGWYAQYGNWHSH